MAQMRVEVLASLLLLLLLFFFFSVREIKAYSGGYDKGGEREGEGEGEEEGEEEMEMGRELFLLKKSKEVVKTDAGEFRVLKGYRRGGAFGLMNIGFIDMEPNSLFIPQYIDSGLILFVRRGELRIGLIYKDELVEKNLKTGDIYRIAAGSAFYMVNRGKGQKLQIICSIDPSEAFAAGVFQSFYVAGGTYPTSVLAGFERRTLLTALNITDQELSELLTSTVEGPMVYIQSSDQPRRLATLLQVNIRETQQKLPSWKYEEDEEHDRTPHAKKEQPSNWSWRKVLNSLFGNAEEEQQKSNRGNKVDAPDPYNLYDRKPDFQNSYGWSVALDENDYAPLKRSGVGVYLVNLTAGSMMAPHVNPTATEYGVVLKGAGTVQVVFPNGTSATRVEVLEGDVFWVPRYFPFCQTASRSGAMEFFGFTTSARKNRPQFLVGASSLLKTMKAWVMATAFGLNEKKFLRIANAQKASIILPAIPFAPLGEEEERGEKGDRKSPRLNIGMLIDRMV